MDGDSLTEDHNYTRLLNFLFMAEKNWHIKKGARIFQQTSISRLLMFLFWLKEERVIRLAFSSGSNPAWVG